MLPYFFHYGTTTHKLLRRVCDTVLMTSDAQHLNEDSFRSEVHASFVPLVRAVSTPANATGQGDLRLPNLRCTIEIKFANADKFQPLATPGPATRTPTLTEIAKDIDSLRGQSHFAMLGVQLRTATDDLAQKHYAYAEDCLDVPNLTNTYDPIAWYNSRQEKLVSLNKGSQSDWFGPGLYLPACEIAPRVFKTQGGQGMFLKWKQSYRFSRRAILRINDDAYLHEDIFGCAEIGRLIFLLTALDPSRVSLVGTPSDIHVAYRGKKPHTPTDSFLIATVQPARLAGVPKAKSHVPCYDLRHHIARREP